MWFWLGTLGWVALVATFALNRSMGLSTSKRFLIYLVGIPAVAFAAGSWAASGDPCSGGDGSDGDCDLAGLAFFWVGMFGAVVGFGTALVFEGIRAFLRAADRYEQR